MPRQKGCVFSPIEREVLIELVNNNKHIIENKVNNAKIIIEKEKTWEIIADDFNARHGVNARCSKQLKALWKNMKAKTKSAVATTRREQKKTGGGPALYKGLSDADVRICGILPNQIQSLSNPYDDDAEFHGDREETEYNVDESECLPPPSLEQNESLMPPSMIMPLFCQDEISRPNTMSQSASNIHPIITSQPAADFYKKKDSDTNNNLKTTALQLMIKEHKQKMKEQEEKMKFFKEEHEFRMKCLRSDKEQKDIVFKEKMDLLSLKRQKLQNDMGKETRVIPQRAEECRRKRSETRIWNPLF